MSHRTGRRAVLAGGALTAALSLGGVAAAEPPPHSHGRGRGKGVTSRGKMPDHAQRPGAGAGALGPLEPPLEFGYFRTWHDQATDPTRPNSIAEVPAEVDVVLVFPDYTPDDSPFWPTLREEYVPTLHARGQRLVRTTDIRSVLDPAFPDTAAGHRATAEHLVQTMVLDHDLDGLDIDMESTLDQAATERAIGVFEELARLLGPSSGTDLLFIYDTNRDGRVPLFQATAQHLDFVLLQAYGRDPGRLQGTWETFAPYIPSERFMPGFSFYEENDRWNRWDDTSEPFEQSRAVAYADWQPDGDGTKAGIFSYAIDRDWVALGDDRIQAATYDWSTRLKHRMLERA